MPNSLRMRWFAVALALALVTSLVAAVLLTRPDRAIAGAEACAPGFQPVDDALREVRAEMRAEGEYAEEAGRDAAEAEREAGEEHQGGDESELVREAVRELPMLRGTDPEDWDHLCVVSKRPESLQELNALFETRAMARLAPYGAYRDGAGYAAARQAAALRTTPAASGSARQYGRGPLIVDDPAYPEVNGLGLADNMGRIDSFALDPAHHRIFAAVGNGGIWRSDDLAAHWTDATGNLPTTVTGAVGWTRYRGGRLIALTGEPTFGASAYTGLGAYWSGDLGRHWTRATGVPAGALGFAVAVDPANPATVYLATQKGLYGSTDGGRSYRNLRLPTGPCAGVTDTAAQPECALANVVTDVVVGAPRGGGPPPPAGPPGAPGGGGGGARPPGPGGGVTDPAAPPVCALANGATAVGVAATGGVGTSTRAGTVVATVGWRGGQRTNPDGSVQSPHNGVYRSATGTAGSFRRLDVTGFAAPDAIGRVELGNAVGPQQDHDILYAVVQDANLLNHGGLAGIDAPDALGAPPVGTTVLNGIYVSTDFGSTWTELVSGTELTADPTTGSALIGTGTAIGYQPGVQGWYNQWIQPDPTRADANGVPTRLAFGLEEIWTNDLDQAGAPLDGSVPVHFAVVGKYFGGDSCLLLSAGLPACPTDRDPTDDGSTTHPDQQDGLWIADPAVAGGVQLVVGNDGGAYRYRFEDDPDGELDNGHWGRGDQTGFDTLMPYFAAMANDGTVYAGLQDNGNLKIDGKSRKQYETYGGDGFFSAVDPFDSKTAYEEYTNGAISVTVDGGTSWASIDPGLTASKFSNPFAMDPTNAKHLVTAGREVVETLLGPSTTSGMTDAADADASTTSWLKVFDLGTRSAPGNPDASSSAADPDNSMSAIATRRNATYVGFCGFCDTLNKLSTTASLFRNGLATNVGGSGAPAAGTAAGWHVVKPEGLPNRYITSIAIDPKDQKTVYVTLGGYTRRWLPPGAVGDANAQIGRGHLFVSHDAGRHFRDISGNLPDSPASWVTVRRHQLLVGTDVGAFASGARGTRQSDPRFARFAGLPAAPVSSIQLKPDNPNVAVLALFGRGVWTYTFTKKYPVPDNPGPQVPTVDTVVKSWDFEADAQGWTAEGAPSTWTREQPGHGSGTAEDADGFAFDVAGPLNYLDNADTTLTSPATAVPSGTGVLRWSMRLDTEGGFDPVTAQVSTDGGTTWSTLGTYSGKNPDAPGWSTYAVAFPAPGGDVQVRFHFTSDSLCSGLGGPVCSSAAGWDGVHVDDVTLGTTG